MFMYKTTFKQDNSLAFTYDNDNEISLFRHK